MCIECCCLLIDVYSALNTLFIWAFHEVDALMGFDDFMKILILSLRILWCTKIKKDNKLKGLVTNFYFDNSNKNKYLLLSISCSSGSSGSSGRCATFIIRAFELCDIKTIKIREMKMKTKRKRNFHIHFK